MNKFGEGNKSEFVEITSVMEVILMSIEKSEDFSAALKMYQSLLESEKQISEGKTNDAKESLENLRNKYGIR